VIAHVLSTRTAGTSSHATCLHACSSCMADKGGGAVEEAGNVPHSMDGCGRQWGPAATSSISKQR
jgi:hypothetical protein